MTKDQLSKRDIKIMQLICREFTTQEVADTIGLSLKRTEQLRSEILLKTKSKNTVGIVKFAIKNNIYSLK